LTPEKSGDGSPKVAPAYEVIIQISNIYPL